MHPDRLRLAPLSHGHRHTDYWSMTAALDTGRAHLPVSGGNTVRPAGPQEAYMSKSTTNPPATKTGRKIEPDAPVKDLQKQVNRTATGRFAPGQSGNPHGRPQGARGRAAMALTAALEGRADEIANALIEQAVAGDIQALKLCVDRICPVPRERPILAPELADVDASTAPRSSVSGAIFHALASGDLTPAEATALLTAYRQHLTDTEIEAGDWAFPDVKQILNL